MKKVVTLIALAVMAVGLHAQDEHEMIVEPTDVGVLDQTILGDTTAAGERNDPDRVYVLRRGAPYVVNQLIAVGDFHLRIKAEDGDGARPILISNVDDGGNGLSQMFRTNSGGHLSLQGVHIAGRDILSGLVNRLIRVSGNYSKVVVDDCILDESGQSGFRLNADSIRIFVSNSLINRMGAPTNPNNGRFLDNRGHPIDTLSVKNCVIYATTSRIYRHSGPGYLHHAFFDQNTFFGSGQWGLTFSPADELKFTNNVFANPVFHGWAGEQRWAVTIDTLTGNEVIDISYNNFFVDPAWDAALPAVSNNTGDTIYSVNNAFFGPNISEALNASPASTTNISEVLEFSNPPEVATAFIEAAHDTTVSAGPWDFSDLTADEVYSGAGGQGIDRYTIFHDFSYSEAATSFTAGDQGQKLGADLSVLGTAVKEDFFTRDNILYFPNPVRNELFIQNLDKAELSLVQIFDLHGNAIRQQRVNNSNTVFNIPEVPAGIYVLSVKDSSGKISSRKILKL